MVVGLGFILMLAAAAGRPDQGGPATAKLEKGSLERKQAPIWKCPQLAAG